MNKMVIALLLILTWTFPASSGVAGPKGDAKAGLELHKKYCVRCHGEQGKGDGPGAKMLKTKPANWTDKALMSKISDDELFKVIREGGGAVGKAKAMPGFKDKLKDADVQNLIAFIRTLAP
ncbi:MAG: cytochrome c [Acidobacteria bacterium]|nr:cytochrome c [Acidobacteriota bacterium]